MNYDPECYEELPRSEVADTLYQHALGAVMLRAVKAAHPEEISALAERTAVKTLAKIHAILNDESLNDRDCFLKIDSIVTAFYNHANIYTDRHIEYD